jgi:spore coat polysaccharide biosynthesis protein SpsF (cytidylyltransferase family)
MQEMLSKIEKKITLKFKYKMNKLGILIYARTDSKRFPGKVLKLINKKKTLIELVHSRVKKKSKNYLVIVNTSIKKSDDKIVSICKKNKINFFRGDLTNVFERTIQCCKKYKLDAFVRVNADRPFFDYDLMAKMIKIFNKNKFDIVTNQLSKMCPKGLACEIAKTKIFYEVKKKSLLKNDKEHIFNYFYKSRKNYKIKDFIDIYYKKKNKLNLSIDLKKDFKNTEKIFKKFKYNFIIDTKTVLKEMSQKS